MSRAVFVVLFVTIVGGVLAQPDMFSKRSFDCDSSYSITCFKLDIVSFLESATQNKEYTLIPGVSVVREAAVNDTKTAEIVAGKNISIPKTVIKDLINLKA